MAKTQPRYTPKTFVRHHKADALKLSFTQIWQKLPPTLAVFTRDFGYAKDFPVAFSAYSHGHKDENVLHFTCPGSFEPYAVQKNMGILPFERAITPGFHALKNILVPLADRTWAEPTTL